MNININTLKNTLKKLCLYSLSTLLITLSQTQNTVSAQNVIADSPCDIDGYFETLKSRAWLEAQREITQNQNLIYKPDSVLEYTCFGQFGNVLLSQFGIYDEESPHYKKLEILLDSIVGSSLARYLKANFDIKTSGNNATYDLLGGHADFDYDFTYDPPPGHPEQGGFSPNGSYDCSIMNQIWETAKCGNFINPDFENGFYTFSDYANNDDKRQIPNQCAGPGTRWQADMIQSGMMESPPPYTLTLPWIRDAVDTYLNLTNEENCSASLPISTGIMVTDMSAFPPEYDEKICIKPGCYYDRLNDKCKSNE